MAGSRADRCAVFDPPHRSLQPRPPRSRPRPGPPRRRLHAVYGVLCLLGVATLLPYNAVISNANFFEVRLRGAPRALADSFEAALVAVFQVTCAPPPPAARARAAGAGGPAYAGPRGAQQRGGAAGAPALAAAPAPGGAGRAAAGVGRGGAGAGGRARRRARRARRRGRAVHAGRDRRAGRGHGAAAGRRLRTGGLPDAGVRAGARPRPAFCGCAPREEPRRQPGRARARRPPRWAWPCRALA